jgi:hypothetical protein
MINWLIYTQSLLDLQSPGIPEEYFCLTRDSDMDTQMGKTAGCKTILVSDLTKTVEGSKRTVAPDFVASFIYDAAKWIIDQLKPESTKTSGESLGAITC